MYKFYSYILPVIFLLATSIAFAQNDTDVVDTAEMVTQTFQKTTFGDNRFLPLTQPAVVDVKKVPAQKREALKNDDNYWYANVAPEKKEVVTRNNNYHGGSFLDAAWFSTLLWIIIITSFVAVIIWYLLSSNINLFRKAPKAIDEEEEPPLTEDIFALNYEKEIARAVAAENYRLAVRLWYLQTLKALADKNRIDYRQDKTNSEYLNQLLNTNYYRDFFKLTRNFEYTWYGQFPLKEEGYRSMENAFQNFKTSIR